MTAASPTAGSPGSDASAPQRSRRRVVAIFSVFVLVSVGALGVLGYAGYRASLGITGGTLAKTVTNPNDRGYQAAVKPSPVYLAALVNDSDELGGLLMVAPVAEAGGSVAGDSADGGSGGGGTLLWTLPELQVEGTAKPATLRETYATAGLAGVRAAFEKVIGYAMTDAAVIGPKQFQKLLGVASVSVENPDPVVSGTGSKRTVIYKSGNLDLAPAQLADFVTIRGTGEAADNRSNRVFVAFTAIAKEVGKESTVPDTTLGADLATLDKGRIDTVALPVTMRSSTPTPTYVPDAAKIESDLAGIVRFPTSAFPGQRPRVRILNGTSETKPAQTLAPQAASAGGEVILIGNGPTTDVETSMVTYSSPAFEKVAKKIADMLKVEAVRSDSVSDAADIDVLLGADYHP